MNSNRILSRRACHSLFDSQVECGPNRKNVLWASTIAILLLIVSPGPAALAQSPDEEQREQRRRFQTQEMIPARFGSWIFQVENPPRLIWRDVDEARRLGCGPDFQVRWFDGELMEADEPNKPGRWIAWVEGQAPNGTPLRRSFTFFALPQKLESTYSPDLTVAFPNFPGADAPQTWKEHQHEFDRAATQLLPRSLLDNELGAILVAGIAEAEPLGRARRFVESTSVVNADRHVALKLKLQNLQDQARPLQAARWRQQPAPQIRQGTPGEAQVPPDAKAKIDEFCQQWVAATNEPFVTLVAKNGVIVTHRAFGTTADGKPIDLGYRCWLASITKTVTALMFSQFVDQKRIDFDDPVSTVFPDYPRNDPHVPTFRQCLNHTSGLSGHTDFGGLNNPHLENIILNGIDVNLPGKAHQYSGLGFELVAKAMENMAGKSAPRVYQDHLFEPLGFGDVVLRNASADCELTALELAKLGQWMVNRGSYGDREFVSPETFDQLLPRQLDVPGSNGAHGLGMNWVRHRKPGAPANSEAPQDLLFSPQTVGHGSFSGCILVVDLEQQLVIVQVRKKFSNADSDWWTRFFQTVAAAIEAPVEMPQP